jgi:para-nitrobenzyl esterase
VFEGFARVTSEECLTLNVWVPTTAGDAHLPVLVWIHGGAFYQGSGGDDFNDGARLAARAGAIVVTINYRLGPLGFLSHRALAREEGRRASPSFGLLDQRAALQWVQRNIAAFGGDPARVTVAGQSAGAWSVCAQLTSPGSRGLFTRAIMESGACSDALYFQPAKAEQQRRRARSRGRLHRSGRAGMFARTEPGRAGRRFAPQAGPDTAPGRLVGSGDRWG